MLCKALAGLIAAATLAAQAPAQTVDELIARSSEARGGLDKLRAVQTIRMKGKMSMGPGLEARITIEMKRPRNARMEFTYQGLTGVQAYDGKQAWGMAPGSRQAEPLPAEMARGLDSQGDIDGPLVDYKAKGHRVELVGKEKIESGDAWKLKLTLKSGDVQYVYLDAVSHLEIRTEARRRRPRDRGRAREHDRRLPGGGRTAVAALDPVGTEGPAGEAGVRVRVDRGGPGARRRALQDADCPALGSAQAGLT